MTAAIALVVAGGVLGRALASAQRRRAAALAAFSPALMALKHAMLTRKLPLAEALAATAHFALIAMATRMRETPSLDPGACWREVYERLGARGEAFDCLGREEVGAIQDLFDSLVAHSAGEVALRLDDAAHSLTEITERAKKARDEKGKLYTSLGALGGMALAILLV